MKYLFLLGCITVVLACNNAVPASRAAEKKDTAVAAGATRAKDTTFAADSTTLNGSWLLQPQLASDTAAGKIPRINFDVATARFTGNTGCNSMNGRFEKNGNSLVISRQVITTKMACMGYNEKAFLDNLFRVNRYEIKDGVLLLKEDETVLFRWVRKLAAPVNKV